MIEGYTLDKHKKMSFKIENYEYLKKCKNVKKTTDML